MLCFEVSPLCDLRRNVARNMIKKYLTFLPEPGWRNWQTQRTQNPPVLGTLGVQLPLPAPESIPCAVRDTELSQNPSS